MKFLSVILTAFLLGFFTLGLGQHTGNMHYHQNNQAASGVPGFTTPDMRPPNLDNQYFFLQIDALYNKVPDAYLAIFNVTQLGKSATESQTLIQRRIEGFKEALLAMGIGEEDVFVDMISQIPIYEYQLQKKVFSKSYQEIPAGIELQKNLHIRFSDGNLMDKIMAAAAKQEIYELVKVDYLVTQTEKIYQELKEAAFAQVNSQLESYQSLGVRFDTLPMIFGEKQFVTYPTERYASYQSKSGAALQDKIKDSSQVKQFRQAQTVYYQSLPVDQYEIVIHPLANEPTVQYTYQLLLRYQRTPPKAQVTIQKEIQREKEFILLTPDGNTRTLQIQSQDK